uniref:Non-canonical E2 ubiquitin-conjugating enzyme C-terminal domain-containing protein n=1 Tax=Mantoniella antarctica TaxID=81844 RepID=A0A7S0X7U2_9CHLO
MSGLSALLDGEVPESGTEASDAFERAEAGRAQAESDANEGRRRLEVARQQFAEYANARADESVAFGEQIQKVLGIASEAAGTHGDDAVMRAMVDGIVDLAEAATGAKAEAQAMAATAMEDVNKAGAGAPGGDGGDGGGDGGAGAAMEEEANGDKGDIAMEDDAAAIAAAAANLDPAMNFVERAKYIPLRLDMEERKLLRLLEAAMHVSEYTDKVDVLTYRSKTGRITEQLKEICAIMCGLVVATDYRRGQRLIVDKDFAANAAFFQAVFEIGRRHKVQNPEKMRSEYGKMVYLLQDSQMEEVQELLEFKLVKPLKTAHNLLADKSGLAMLADGLMHQATAEIMHEGKARHEVQREIKAKEKAREHLSRRYATAVLSSEDILSVLYSISDNNSYLRFNRDPVDKMIGYLKEYFEPKTPEKGFSLGITMGMGGARLSHNHERQYTYVMQSMMLWREVSNDMFKLWYLAEGDLLREGGRYQLTNTGQGLNRVQSAPGTNKAIHQVLNRCQSKLGHWVGSSVVHLGDHNVPNALMFIDKYTQVPRILNPVALVVSQVDELCKDPGLLRYVEGAFGSADGCRKAILADFFRHAFDGSGADNFFDAGSCIDGRLTSAWNWCSKIEKKGYYPVFKLSGFTGFDGGDFRS